MELRLCLRAWRSVSNGTVLINQHSPIFIVPRTHKNRLWDHQARPAKIRQIQLPKPKLNQIFKILKFAIDNGRRVKSPETGTDRSDKDRCNSASPKPTLAAASATTTCGLRPRSTSGSLAQCPWIVAGERDLIFNTQQAVAKGKFR